MKNRIADFQRYRNSGCLIAAMAQWCKPMMRSQKGIKAVCPRPECFAGRAYTLKCYWGSSVAHCYACQRTMDALDICRHASGMGYQDAVNELEIICASYLQCNT